MFKKYAVFTIAASLLITMALITTACDSGKLKTNVPPQIFITSYAGEEAVDTAETEPAILFQQTIYWNAYDSDGSVVGYAYRVLNKDGVPIVTPGNDSIDVNGVYTPAVLKAVDSKHGWVFRTPTGITDPDKRTIWTDRVSAVINFPANVDGDSAQVVSRFDVVAIDNRGDISNIATKYIQAQSFKPVAFASTSKGTFEKEVGGVLVPSEVGQGFKLVFSMNDNDPYVGSVPWYFEYQLSRYPLANPDDIDVDTTLVSPVWESAWLSTKNEQSVNEKILTATSNPPLVSNFNADFTQKETITVLRVRAIDLAGIKSDTKAYKFFVNGKYFPQSLLYHKKCYVLSDNHYVENQDDSGTEVVPFIQTPSGYKIARPFYLEPVDNEVDGVLQTPTKFKPTAICNSTNGKTKIWLRWGYRGEFEGNDPDNKKVSVPRDSTGAAGVDYQTEISYYLIQLDGTRYQFGPLKDDATQAAMGNFDPHWLKVPAGHDISQKINVGDLEPGKHVFKIKVEDLQGKQDPTPEVFEFEIVRPKPLDERKGVLIITSETSNAMTEQIKDFYVNTAKELLPEGEKVHFVRRKPWSDAIAALPNTMRLFSNNPFAPSLLQQYKYVIYYKDFQPNEADISDDAVTFKSFLDLNGTLIISGGDNIAVSHKKMVSVGNFFFSSHFGLPQSTDKVFTINPQMSYTTKPYITGVTSLKNPPFGNLAVDLSDSQIIALINQRQGLATVSYFKDINPDYALYKTVCKPVNTSDANSPQTDAQYQEYNDRVIALVKENGTLSGTKGKGYLFAFPISVMDKTDAKLLLGNIIK
ncbi:MAG TPA: hypothetical protein PL063_02630 [Candidatus Cloacimonadota bacterium]|nr:hypothetical protein [Candidatus Cloacimonadota bacterium]HQB40741.1 hypothetical protein [Candidatus Cloacimonadota bacterium]